MKKKKERKKKQKQTATLNYEEGVNLRGQEHKREKSNVNRAKRKRTKVLHNVDDGSSSADEHESNEGQISSDKNNDLIVKGTDSAIGTKSKKRKRQSNIPEVKKNVKKVKSDHVLVDNLDLKKECEVKG